MPRFHVYLKGLGGSPVSVQADDAPKLVTTEPWIEIGKSWFLTTEIVAVVADEDLPHSWRPGTR